MRRSRLVIADRHPIVLRGLISVLATEHEFEIVASCSDGASCVEAVRSLFPDVVLLDESLPDVSAAEILAIADAEGRPVRLVLFVSAMERGDLASSLVDGVHSVISKDISPEALMRSLRLVADEGGVLPALSPDLAPAGEGRDEIVDDTMAVLTEREREIMRLVSEGLSNKAVARRLNIAQGTIKVHLHHVYQKLEINNRTVLAALAISKR